MKILFYISFIIACFSCKKKHNISIQANDLNGSTSNAYAGIDFAIVQSRPGWQTDKFDRVYEGIFDENGEASFDLKMQKNWSYILTMSEPDNICYNDALGIRLDNDKSNMVSFNYAKCGYVNLPRINVNCEDENDKFRMKYYYTSNSDIYIFRGYIDENDNWQTNKFQQGCIDFTNVSVFNSRPAGNYTIEWQVERTSGITYGSDTFTIYENDTTNYLIEY